MFSSTGTHALPADNLKTNSQKSEPGASWMPSRDIRVTTPTAYVPVPIFESNDFQHLFSPENVQEIPRYLDEIQIDLNIFRRNSKNLESSLNELINGYVVPSPELLFDDWLFHALVSYVRKELTRHKSDIDSAQRSLEFYKTIHTWDSLPNDNNLRDELTTFFKNIKSISQKNKKLNEQCARVLAIDNFIVR